MPLAKEKGQRFTYADYATWPENERWELIDGRPYDMTPAPGTRHQTIVLKLGAKLSAALEGRHCRCFVAPTDVVLSDYDVVQPDVLVVCDPTKITEANIQGAPDLAIEVASPATGLKDKREKKNLYEKHGVREYILVDPGLGYLERFVLGPDGFYGKGDVFGTTERMQLLSLTEITLNLREVFEEPL
jgi:Uma2 family endonuclease